MVRLRRKQMKAKDILSDASKWTRGAYARNSNCEECSVNSPEAVQYCLLGAVYAIYGYKTLEAGRAIEKLAAAAGLSVDVPDLRLIVWNDAGALTFAEVRSVIEKADV
jgi:hypothetical protein